MARRILHLVVLSLWLSRPAAVQAQLTGDESFLFNKLLAEPDGAPAYEKRLRLIGDAIEREADPTSKPVSTIQVDLKRARIPPADGVPFLLNRIGHSSEVARRTVLRMLGAYGVEAKAAVKEVLKRMQEDTAPLVRSDAMLTLARIDPGNAESAAAILDRLDAAKNDDNQNRATLQALIIMAGAVPKSEAPRIAKFYEHRLTEFGVLAHELIGKVHALKRPTLEQLRKMPAIDWQNVPDQGYAAFSTIGGAGVKAEFAVPLVLGVLDSMPPVYLECVAIDTLAKIRTGDPKAIAAVLERLRPKDFFVRNKASTALLQMDAKQPESVRALAAGLRHKDQSVRMTVATSLRVRDEQGKLPPDAHAEMLAPVLAAIAEFDESMSVNHLETYVMLLRRFGTRAAPAGEHLVKIYQSEAFFKRLGTYGAYVRGKLLAALANIGVPESGRELVLEALQKGPGSLPNEASTFAAAARAAATFADPKQVVPLLLPGLKVKGKEQALYFIDWSGDGQGKPTTVRLEAVRALAKMGPAATEALPALKEVIEGNAESPPSLDLLVRMEARRAYETIDGKPLPAIKGFYADGKKESLHLDERLQVKITMKLRNPRPQDVLNRLQQATKLNFTMNEHVDQETPVWATSHQVNVQVYHAMRQLAAMANIQGTWEDVGDGYRLVAKPRTPDDKAKAAKAAKASFPPFRDDSFDPLPNDPRLQKALSINLTPAKAQDIVRRVQDATGVTLTLENVDTVNPLYAGIGWSNISAWQALRNVAESPRVQGTWEKVGDGYRLRGTQPIPPPGVAPPVVARPVAPKPAIAQADPGQAATAPQPGRRLLLVLGIGLLVIVLAGGAMAFWLRERGV